MCAMEPTQNRRSDFETWPPPDLGLHDNNEMPGWPMTIVRGLRAICPRCGKAKIFNGYLKVHDVCSHCGANFAELPADDAPPYVAMVIVLQVIGVFVVMFYKGVFLPNWPTAIGALLALVIVCMLALRVTKGAIIGVLLKLNMKREPVNG